MDYGLNQLYVGELDASVTEEILYNSFSKFGRINSLKVMRHIVTGASRGFAFINYMNPHDAIRAKENMNGVKFFGKNLRVFLKSEYDSLDPNATVVIQNLNDKFTEAIVSELVRPFGKPFSIKFVKSDKSANELKAFAQFEKMETAKNVIDNLNGITFDNVVLVVELANKKNKVFIKAKNFDNAIQELKTSLAKWKYEESENPEYSLNKEFFIQQLRFETEEMAKQFIEDFRANSSQCSIKRPGHSQRSRQRRFEIYKNGLFELFF